MDEQIKDIRDPKICCDMGKFLFFDKILLQSYES